MKTKLLLACAWLMLLAIALPVFSTSTPTADDGKWYYVKSQRYGSGGPWWTFTSSTIVPGALTKTDVQKFTLVSTPVSGKVTVKEYAGTKLTAATPAGTFDATGAASGWTITPNTVSGVAGTAFPGEGSGLHQGGSSWGWRVSCGWYSLADNCTFFFYEVAADVDLNIAIDDATIRLNTASAGTTIGKTPQSAIDAYTTAINTAKTTLGSTDATAIQTALNDLNSATATFIAAKVPVVQSSTAASPVWYLVKNTNRGGKGSTLYTNGLNVQMKATTVANSVAADGTSTGTAAPTLSHLFRFEFQANGTYRMINAALPSGEVLQAASGGSSSSPIKYGTVTNPATTWNLNFIGFNATLNVNEIKFVSAGNGTVFHDDGSYNLVSWDGGTGSASAWYTEQYTGNVSALYQTQYDALTTEYNAIADGSGNAVAPYSIGLEPGQYDATKFQTVKDAYAAMVTEKNTNGVTSSNIIQKFTDLSVAMNTFKASKVAPVAYTGAINSSANYTLKLVQSGSANDGFYLSNPRTDANNGLDSNRPYATFSDAINATTTIWRLVASATAGKYILVSNRRAGFTEYIDEEGRVRDASSYVDNSWTTKTLMQNTLTFNEGTTLLIVKIDQNSNYYTTSTAIGATLGRSSTSWSTFKLEPYIYSANTEMTGVQTKAYAVNGVIKVSNTNEFEVYTITGSKIMNRNLVPGCYFVKTASETIKVLVK